MSIHVRYRFRNGQSALLARNGEIRGLMNRSSNQIALPFRPDTAEHVGLESCWRQEGNLKVLNVMDQDQIPGLLYWDSDMRV